VTPTSDPAALRAALAPRADAAGLVWLDERVAEAAADPAAIRTAFPSVSRRVGRQPLDPADVADDPFAWTVDDAARALLVAALPDAARPDELREVYRHGDARERRGALRSLDVADGGPAAPALVGDALRANDVRLVAAALGPAGVASLDDDAFAQAVLKALFVGLDVVRIPRLLERTTPRLSAMAADYVHERVAAGRDVPAAIWRVVDVHPPADRIAAIEAERDHPTPSRAAAARAALALRG
jgi:hypothetical protein